MKRLTLKERAFQAISLELYIHRTPPEILNKTINVKCPFEKQYILRMLIKRDGIFFVPEELMWILPILNEANNYQTNVLRVEHPFCYVTVRSGLIESKNDDVWHVDGFSTRITHLPEQSYGWCDSYPTQYNPHPVYFPPDFDPLKHNIHSYIQHFIGNSPYISFPEKKIFCFDPYVIHRRPYIPKNRRTFVRISFTPIEINDINNTLNPLLSTNYTKDGVKDFRDKLKNYYEN